MWTYHSLRLRISKTIREGLSLLKQIIDNSHDLPKINEKNPRQFISKHRAYEIQLYLLDLV